VEKGSKDKAEGLAERKVILGRGSGGFKEHMSRLEGDITGKKSTEGGRYCRHERGGVKGAPRN